MTADPEGLICPRSGSGSLSGQYIMHGNVGSVEMLRTRPPALSACPDGVSSGYVGVCGFAFSVSGPRMLAPGERVGDVVRELGSEYRPPEEAGEEVTSGGRGGSGRRCCWRSSCAWCAKRGEMNCCWWLYCWLYCWWCWSCGCGCGWGG